MIGGSSITDFRAHRQPVITDWTCALLAGSQLLKIGLGAINKSERTRAITARVAGWLVASLPVHPDDGGATSQQRAQAGDVLAQIGDPRFDPERFHLPADDLLGFVRIPADPEFRIGTRKADAKRIAKIIGAAVPDNEINDAPTPTPEFYIARYPVTVAQFKAFVGATKFKVGNARALGDPDSRPVRWVSWNEALAYCEWLNDMLATSAVVSQRETGRLVRERQWCVALPSELEWEKAARGGLPDAVFSWGDTPDPNRANYAESGIGDTSAVGCFPANGFGLHDMIGNVWEWTRSCYKSYPFRTDDDRKKVKGST
ncbi:MAG: formylglycine-generating enzyme family protein, partial [Gammaproteobacteria bacterium]